MTRPARASPPRLGDLLRLRLGSDRNRILARILYPHARLLRPLIESVCPRFFTFDRELVDDLLVLADREEFRFLATTFHRHADNIGFLRRHLRLRTSIRRTQALLRRLVPAPAPAHIDRPSREGATARCGLAAPLTPSETSPRPSAL